MQIQSDVFRYVKDPDGRGTAQHEAGHLAAALLLGLDVVGARVDEPEPGNASSVTFGGAPGDKDEARRRIVATIAPWADEGRPIQWTDLDVTGEGDAGIAARLVGVYGIEAWEWPALETHVDNLRKTRAYKDLLRAAQHALLERAVLGPRRDRGASVNAAVAPPEGRQYRWKPTFFDCEGWGSWPGPCSSTRWATEPPPLPRLSGPSPGPRSRSRSG